MVRQNKFLCKPECKLLVVPDCLANSLAHSHHLVIQLKQTCNIHCSPGTVQKTLFDGTLQSILAKHWPGDSSGLIFGTSIDWTRLLCVDINTDESGQHSMQFAHFCLRSLYLWT